MEINIGEGKCMYDNGTYIEGALIENDRFTFQCINIGYDYNGNKMMSFEIPGPEEMLFGEKDLIDMGIKTIKEEKNAKQ